MLKSSRFETTTENWLAVDNAVPLFHKISYARLYAASIHLGSFGKIRESCLLLYASDFLLVSNVNNGNNGSGRNPPDLVGLRINGGSNGSGGSPPGLVGPSVNSDTSNGSGRNPPSLVRPGRKRFGSAGSVCKAIMSKKDTSPKVDDDSERISSLANHDSMARKED